jgi:phage FluMu protein Com
MRCRHCGRAKDEARETVPYVGPGSRVVELRDMQVLRCTGCGQMSIEVPELRSLDTLVRCLVSELSGTLPQLTFDEGRWRIVPRQRSA